MMPSPAPGTGRALRSLLLIAAGAILVAGCRSSLEIRTNIDSITVTAAKSTIEVGEPVEVTAAAFDEEGNELAVGFDWNSNIGSIRLLARNRIQFQSIETGTATIAASVGLQGATTTVEVVQAE